MSTVSNRAPGAALAALALLVLACCGGCVRLRPLQEVRSELATGRLLEVHGNRIYVERQGHGEPVVLVHGFGASSYSWRKVLPDLARDYDVVAVDLFGFGLTDRPAEREAYTREGQIRMLLGLLDALGFERAHFIGHSYGGALTMTLVAQHPERVRSMVLVDSAEPDYPLNRRRWLARIRPLIWMYVTGRALRHEKMEKAFRRAYHDDALVTDEVVEAYLDRLRVKGSVKAYRKLTRPRPSAPRGTVRYEELAVPALVVWGAEDRLVTVETAAHNAALLPDHRFVSIEGAGHSPMEERPEEFLAHVTEFLDEVSRRGSP